MASKQQQDWHDIAVYLQKKHNIEYSVVMRLINEIDTDLELGEEYLKEHLKSINTKREHLQKVHSYQIPNLQQWPDMEKLEKIGDSLEENSLTVLAEIISDIQNNNPERAANDLLRAKKELEKLRDVIKEELSGIEQITLKKVA